MIFDPKFQIQSDALAIANLLDNYSMQRDMSIQSYPYYNGRERGICLIVSEKPTDSYVLAIFFGRHCNSDHLFVQHEQIARPFNAPSAEDKTFSEHSYKNREYLPAHHHLVAAKRIVSLILDY